LPEAALLTNWLEHRLALGDASAFPVFVHHHRLVERVIE
jgi:hypothetical protein